MMKTNEEVLIFHQAAQTPYNHPWSKFFFLSLFIFNKINFWIQQLRSQLAGKDLFPFLGSLTSSVRGIMS